MKKILLILTVAGIVYGAACANTATRTSAVENTEPAKVQSPTPVPDAHAEDTAPRITLADAKKDYDAGNAILIDVRDEAAYKLEHIAEAINITPQTLDASIGKLQKGKKLIVYCS